MKPALFRRFFKNTSGNVAPIFAIAAIPLITATGAAVDYSSAYRERWQVQDALDAAALAGGKMLGSSTDEEIEEVANNYYLANLKNKVASPPALEEPDIDGATLTLNTALSVPTRFLQIIGIDSINFDLQSQVTVGSGRLEVAIVLDNSTSMAGTKISTLKTAAAALVGKLFDLGESSTKEDPIKVALVPFGGSVNVGPSNKTASWMDQTGAGTYMGETFEQTTSSPPINVWSLFTAMNNQSWGGCVEERPIPNDVSDATPTTTDPTTLFVPMFAPDEPDNWTCTTSNCNYTGSGSSRAYSGAPGGSQSYNNYIKDTGVGSNCTGANDDYVNSSNEQAAIRRTCKYTGATPTSTITVGGLNGGPNFYCSTAAIMPLTTNESTVTTAINGMVAKGATSIMSGVAWGLRVLSPSEPFTQGRAYDDEDNTKIMVVMTDGENTYYPNSKFVKSWYGSYGYIWKGHLGTTSTSTSTINTKQNERTAQACQNAKDAGVKVYTVAFNITDPATLQMMEDCASEDDMAFQSTGTTELLAAFTAIGEDISQLRIAK